MHELAALGIGLAGGMLSALAHLLVTRVRASCFVSGRPVCGTLLFPIGLVPFLLAFALVRAWGGASLAGLVLGILVARGVTLFRLRR